MTFPVTKFCAVAGVIFLIGCILFLIFNWAFDWTDSRNPDITMGEFVCIQNGGNYSIHYFEPGICTAFCKVENDIDFNFTKELDGWNRL